MPDFYSTWLAESEEIDRALKEGPRHIRGKDLKWVKTRQDAKAALMIAPENGFPTGGSLLMKAEIPVGWHTGQHLHGEEAIYIEEGQGFLILDDARYDFREGTIFHIPYRSPHQLFNTGTVHVVYLSGLAWPLEKHINMGRMEQEKDCGPNDATEIERFPPEVSQYWTIDERRISMHSDQYEDTGLNRHGKTYKMMTPAAGFKFRGTEVNSLFVEPPHSKSHSHAHPEAYLYCLQGRGYSYIGGKRYDWEKGDAIHVPPAMMPHQHFNPSDGETKELRFGFRISNWFIEQWRGYDTIEWDHTSTSEGEEVHRQDTPLPR